MAAATAVAIVPAAGSFIAKGTKQAIKAGKKAAQKAGEKAAKNATEKAAKKAAAKKLAKEAGKEAAEKGFAQKADQERIINQNQYGRGTRFPPVFLTFNAFTNPGRYTILKLIDNFPCKEKRIYDRA